MPDSMRRGRSRATGFTLALVALASGSTAQIPTPSTAAEPSASSSPSAPPTSQATGVQAQELAELERLARETDAKLREAQARADEAARTMSSADTMFDWLGVVIPLTAIIVAVFGVWFTVKWKARADEVEKAGKGHLRKLRWALRSARRTSAEVTQLYKRVQVLDTEIGKKRDAVQLQLEAELAKLSASVVQARTVEAHIKNALDAVLPVFEDLPNTFVLGKEAPAVSQRAVDADALLVLGDQMGLQGDSPSIRAEYFTKAGRFWRHHGHWEKALARLERAVELDPNLPLAQQQLARALWNIAYRQPPGEKRDRNLRRARQCIDRCWELDGRRDSEDTAFDLGMVELLLGNLDAALEATDKALELGRMRDDGPDWNIVYNQACIHVRRGDYTRALDALATIVDKTEAVNSEGKHESVDFRRDAWGDEDFHALRETQMEGFRGVVGPDPRTTVASSDHRLESHGTSPEPSEGSTTSSS